MLTHAMLMTHVPGARVPLLLQAAKILTMPRPSQLVSSLATSFQLLSSLLLQTMPAPTLMLTHAMPMMHAPGARVPLSLQAARTLTMPRPSQQASSHATSFLMISFHRWLTITMNYALQPVKTHVMLKILAHGAHMLWLLLVASILLTLRLFNQEFSFVIR
jgi:hypothetical protein